MFSLEQEIIGILTDNSQNILEGVADTAQFKTSQALAVDWDQDNELLICTPSWHSIYAFQ